MDYIMKKLIFLLIALLAFLYQYIFYIPSSTNSTYLEQQTPSSSIAVEINKKDKVDSNTFSNNTISKAFTNGSSNIQVQGVGTVIKILRDDLKGSRHQKFIIRLTSGHTLLIAHNIDLAPRINSIRSGDSVKFYGEYEWNSKGGVIHWTHHDPKGRHTGGWLKHNGRTYQ
jgi:hypothetical protein